jgi:peroxiredoxin family protein
MASGAAALGRPVHIFLQYWGLDAFRADRIKNDHGLAAEAGAEGKAAVDALRAEGQAPWYETLAMAKELGNVEVQACSLSMDVLKITEDDLDDLVDGTEGVTAFYIAVGDGQILFI